MKRVSVTLLLLIFGFAVAWARQEAEGVPEPPTNLKASADYEGAVAVASLAWQDESDNEIGFEVLRSDNGEEYRVVGFVGANTARYKDKIGKYISGAFAYKVRAFNQQGKSEDSNMASAWF